MKKIILGLLALGTLVAGVAAVHWFNTAGSSTASIEPEQSNTGVLGTETSLTDWKTTGFKTKRPTWLRQVSAVEEGQSSASYVLRASNERNAQVAVTIAPLGTNTVIETPAVRLRMMKTSEYRPSSLPGAKSGVLVFQHNGEYETAAFWQQGTRSIALVSSGSSDQQASLDSALSAILDNWQWEQ